MFNLLISSGMEAWDDGRYEFHRSRIAIEYTATEISERYRELTEDTINELKSFPTLFVTEGESVESRIGYITNIKLRSNTVVIDFEFDNVFHPLPIGSIEDIRIDIDLGGWELSRTHWAIKDENLFEILVKRGMITQEQVFASQWGRVPPQPEPITSQVSNGFNISQVFIVHGHDEIAKLDMENFIRSIGLEPIILHQQASSGMTIIEKIEHYSNVGFGVVLYTPCDTGNKVGALQAQYRARQNVVFEHGFLIGKLGRARVSAVVKGMVERPNDISGVVYVDMADPIIWQAELKKEMRAAGYNV